MHFVRLILIRCAIIERWFASWYYYSCAAALRWLTLLMVAASWLYAAIAATDEITLTDADDFHWAELIATPLASLLIFTLLSSPLRWYWAIFSFLFQITIFSNITPFRLADSQLSSPLFTLSVFITPLRHVIAFFLSHYIYYWFACFHDSRHLII